MKAKIALIRIDHKKAEIYVLGGNQEEKINEIAVENNHMLQFYKAIEQQVLHYEGLVLAGHGKGSANESHNFNVYLKKKNIVLWNKISGELITDYHETDNQLLARADEIVGEKHIGHHNG